MAPPSAQAKKTQTLRRYGEHGLCLNTRTDVTGVMYSDCFFVEDRFMVEPSPEGGVILTAKFEMRFVKKTMLKGIMETTSRGEYTDFYKGFANMAVEAIESEKDKSEDPKIDELLVAWRKFRNSSEPSFKETSLEGAPLSCSIDEFYNYFLKDNAEYSMEFYQREACGDTDIETSEWENSEDPFMQTRTMKYLHPVNAPMAPPLAPSSKRQELRRFGDHGIYLDTKTRVNGVPMADYFFVEDRLIVEPNPEGGVILKSKFEMRFVKKTMLKQLIENITKGESIEWCKKYAEMARKAVGEMSAKKGSVDEVPQIVRSSRAIPIEFSSPPPPVSQKPPRMHFLTCLVFILSISTFFLSYQVHLMNQSMVRMEMRLENLLETQSKTFCVDTNISPVEKRSKKK
mmetsp:Transcript_21065/g.26793  ORF Transcript_21065/g.26793 Transcript_21065/m.26793 type:complete len:400 (-) Transcript_21065:110-1309(-)